MDLSRIKELIKRNGDRVVLVEKEEPEVVMMSFKEYERLLGKQVGQEKERYNAPIRINSPFKLADLDADKVKETEFIVPLDQDLASVSARPEDIRLEDLPL